MKKPVVQKNYFDYSFAFLSFLINQAYDGSN